MHTIESPSRACTKCDRILSLDEFDVRADIGKRTTRCKDCRRNYQNERIAALSPCEAQPSRLVGTTELLTCTRCGERRPGEAFPRRRRDGLELQTWCRDCFARVKAVHYAQHREEVQQRIYRRAQTLREETRKKLLGYVAGRPCDCGEVDPRQYRFVDVYGRTLSVAGLATSGRAWGTIHDALASATVTCVRCIRAAAGREGRQAHRPRPRTRTTPRPPIGITDGLRRCSKCSDAKPLEEFAPKYRRLPRPSSHCRDCQARYGREWYRKNRLAVIERGRINKQRPVRLMERTSAYLETRRLRWDYLVAHPCVDCGEGDPLVLEFDHRRDKSSAIVDLMRDHAPWDVILSEIQKCDVRCANCHRRRTATTRGYYRELWPTGLPGHGLSEGKSAGM